MAEEIRYIYKIIDKFSPALDKINRANKAFVRGLGKAKGGLKTFGEKAGNLQNALAGMAAGAGLAVVAKKAMDFESVMTDVNKVVEFENKKQFENFREYILKTSVDLGKLPANLAQIAVAGGKLGVLPKDMNEFIGVVARTSVAFDMLEETAGNQIGSIQAKLGLTVNETGNLMDAINFLADNTSAGGARMIEIIARTSGELKGIGMPRKFMAGWAAFADQMEVTPELAASGLNMMVRKLSQMPGMTEKLIAKPHETIASYLRSLSKLDKVKRIKVIDKLFGPEAGRFVKKAVVNMEKFDKTMKLVKDDTRFAGSMMKELQNKLGTAETAWGKMMATMDVVAITLGDVLLPYIKELAPRIVKVGFMFRDWAKAHPTIVKIGLAILAIMAIMAPIVIIAGFIATAIGALSWPIALVIAGFTLVSGAVLGIIVYWDELVEKFKKGLEFIKAKIKEFKEGLNIVGEGFKDAGKEVMGVFEKMDRYFGFSNEENVNIAANNTIASKGTLNGNITVEATKGTDVKGTRMETDVPGNLGFNTMAGVGM